MDSPPLPAEAALAAARVRVLAPDGRDAAVIAGLCARLGLQADTHADVHDLCEHVDARTLAWVATEEALQHGVERLAHCLQRQEPWSDLPVLVLTARRRGGSPTERGLLFDQLGHVTLLERPLRAETLLRAIGAAARTRRRQYQLREEMARIAGAADELDQRVRERTRELQAAIAQREAAEKALVQSQRLEAVGQLTGGVAHDFNNLLQVIVSSTAVLEHADDKPALRQRAVDSIRQTAARGSQLTQQLLAFASRQPLTSQDVDLRLQLRTLADMLRRSLREDIRLSFIAPTPLWHVRADAAQLDVALLNLAVNARDAMPEGGALTIALRNEVVAEGGPAPSGRYVVIDVTDTGHGMDEATAAKAFEPFFTTKERGKGTGLGLSQVYGFARQSGGAAFVRATSPAGTTIALRLPALAEGIAPSPPAPAREPAADPQAAWPGWQRVLVVEDEPAVAEATCQMLQSLGLAPVLAHSAEAALRVPLDGIDFVFTDVIMPGRLDGVALAHELRRRQADLPILLASGYVGAPERLSGSGFPLLNKPYTRDELVQAITGLAEHAALAH